MPVHPLFDRTIVYEFAFPSKCRLRDVGVLSPEVLAMAWPWARDEPCDVPENGELPRLDMTYAEGIILS